MMLTIMVIPKVMLSNRVDHEDNYNENNIESLRSWRVSRAFQRLQLCGRNYSLRLQVYMWTKGLITPQGRPAGHPLMGPGGNLLGVSGIHFKLQEIYIKIFQGVSEKRRRGLIGG